jgi:aspartate/methionine/tyrosine aminotransferase
VLQDKSIAFPALSYGPDSGDPRLRKNLASWLTSFYRPADAIAEDRICITGGASQNLACLLQVYTDPVFTRNVWIVAPAYMLSFRIFEDAGFHGTLRAVPEDDEGIDIEYLRSEIQKSENKAKADGNNEPVCTARVSGTYLHTMPHIRISHGYYLYNVREADPLCRYSNLHNADRGPKSTNTSSMQYQPSQTLASKL